MIMRNTTHPILSTNQNLPVVLSVAYFILFFFSGGNCGEKMNILRHSVISIVLCELQGT